MTECDEDRDYDNVNRASHKSGHGDSETTPVDQQDSATEYVTYEAIHFNRSPAKDICNLAVATFEKMELSHLKILEQLNNTLRATGKLSVDQLISFSMKIMTEIWNGNDELELLLRSNQDLTKLVGQEMLVLFDNIMLNPIGSSKKGNIQRYAKTCLDNSIQHIYNDSVPKDCWGTYETVISTYTSPTAFTPEMESLINQAARLGISTQDLNLKKFITERSLTAFLKKVIYAKSKKSAFITKFNNRLLNVLTNVPNNENKRLQHKFKHSFSKFYQYAIEKQEEKSKTAPFKRYNRRTSQKNKLTIPQLQNTDRMESIETDRFTHKPKDPRSERDDTICNKCHNPHGKRYSLVKSASDSFISSGSGDSFANCQCFDNAKKVWDKRMMKDKPRPVNSLLKINKRNKRSSLVKQSELIEPKISLKEEPNGFSLLTEQRSFFRLGEGAFRNAITEYFRLKDAPFKMKKDLVTKTQAESAAVRPSTKQKRVRWFDQTSLDTIYGSLMDLSSDYMRIKPISNIIRRTKMDFWIVVLITSLIPVARRNKSLGTVIISAIARATLLAVTMWICYFIYVRSPRLAIVNCIRLTSE